MFPDNCTEVTRELLVYLISHQQWNDATDMYQQEFGTTPAVARAAVDQLAEKYGYRRSKAVPMTIAACALFSTATAVAGVLNMFAPQLWTS